MFQYIIFLQINQTNKRKNKQPQTSDSAKRSTLNSHQCNSKTNSGMSHVHYILSLHDACVITLLIL